MDIFGFDAATFLSFLLTLMRISLIVFLFPFYGGDSIPPTVKALTALVLTLAVWPHLAIQGGHMPSHPADLVLIMVGELILGLMLALCIHFVFAGIQTAGEIMGFQMGFTMVTLADPLSGTQASVTSVILYMISLMVFLTLDGHLILLHGLASSFYIIPPGGIYIGAASASTVIELSGQMFSVAVQVAGPVLAALFMVELTLALMGRAAPQMNLLTLGFPLKIAIGFFFIGMLLNILSLRLEDTIIDIAPLYDNLMRMSR